MGLVLVKPTSIANSGGTASLSGGAVTFTGVTNVSLNGCFTSAYENYLLKIRVTGSAANEGLVVRYRAAGTDNSSSSYIVQSLSANDSVVNAGRGTQTAASIGNVTSDYLSGIDTNIYGPQLATVTNHSSLAAFARVGGLLVINVGTFTGTTQFDGLTLQATSGTITGTIRVYGYKNS